MELHNYTPHTLTHVSPNGTRTPLPKLGEARCSEFHQQVGSFDPEGEFIRTVIRYGDVTGLPDPEPGVVYVVSQITAAAAPEREDLAFPAGLLRDERGSITGFTLLGYAASPSVDSVASQNLIAPAFNPLGPIFISYRTSDGLRNTEVLDHLVQAAGVPIWRDRRDLGTGNVRRRLDEALTEGLSGAIVVATTDVGTSDIVRECELPRILQLEESFGDFSLAIANAVGAAGVQAMDPGAPERLLGTESGRLAAIKQFDVRDPQGQGAVDLVKKILTEHLDGRLRVHPLVSRPFSVDVQTRLRAAAHCAESGDLSIRLAWDEAHHYPTRQALDALGRMTVPISDELYNRGISVLRFTGGMHVSVALALGCTYTQERRFPGVVECAQQAAVWSSADAELPTSRELEAKPILFETSDPSAGRVAAFVTMSPNPHPDAFIRLLDTQGPFRSAHRIRLADEDELVGEFVVDPKFLLTPEDGPALARRTANFLRKLATQPGVVELHLAFQGPQAFALLLGRFLNTVPLVVYELDADPDEHYVPIFRLKGGTNPIQEVLVPTS